MKPIRTFAWSLAIAALMLVLLAGLFGCTVRKEGEGRDKKVDIQTPVGSLHVNTDVDPRDTGMDVYPGASRVADSHDEHAANVKIDSGPFGVKVVAIKYRSDDPPDKLLDFYRKQLKTYGQVTECRGGVSFHRDSVQCDSSIHPGQISLVTGTEERHHAVEVRPDGKGSQFALVYIQTRGERGTL